MRKNSNTIKVLGLNDERPLFVPSTPKPPVTVSKWDMRLLFGTLGYLLGAGIMFWVYIGQRQYFAAYNVLLIFVCPGVGLYTWLMIRASYLRYRHIRWLNRETNKAIDIIKERYFDTEHTDRSRSIVEALMLGHFPEDKE